VVTSHSASSGYPGLDLRSATRYGVSMIRSFRHAGLEKFYLTGSKAGIQPVHAAKLRRQLTLLNTAKNADRMNVPGWDLHPLKGGLADHWSVKVSGNWRMTFTFENQNAILVDYQDYH
jgi:proteic killer suppression protein